ncbi:MAG: NAD(P)(+) transhydrogenase (Re/Si-specific) subunit beta [Phycisphaerae bacterium]
MSANVTIYAYLVAAVLFVFGLKMMSSPKTARRGNAISAFGMLIAIVFTIFREKGTGFAVHDIGWLWVILGIAIGSAIGAVFALKVKMTGMPEMVALFNGFGGLASGVVVLGAIFQIPSAAVEFIPTQMAVATTISTLIGWVTFTGSLVAFAKLGGYVIPSAPITFPAQKIVNVIVLLVSALLIILSAVNPEWRWLNIPLLFLAGGLGILFTIPIGGADMPVVISLLNSYSGLAACATGFVLGNPGLIIAGSLVGASGLILTRLMCVAMNRSLGNVLFGAVGATGGGDDTGEKRCTSWTAEDAALCLSDASYVVIVPGYGMAVAQAQHAVKEMTDILEQRGIQVKFGVHPVAGRMPGHMNVLLAEAEVDYDKLMDMDEINPEFAQVDTVVVLGANDVVNPIARTEEGGALKGMPILDIDKARQTIIIKRSLSPGFAGVDNPQFYADNNAMLFGDGKAAINDIIVALKTG